jgi:DNA-binding NtrC family response regulator
MSKPALSLVPRESFVAECAPKANPRPTHLVSVGNKPREVVLFVDDEEALLEAMQVAMRKEPFEIVTASSAAQALEILATRAVDVVISDERMPGMPGSEFLSLVRQKFPDTIRLILTGQASLEAATRAINEGEIYRFLMKPCPLAVMAVTVKDALALRGLKRESSRLLATVKQQRVLLEDLEKDHPGITHVEKNLDGCIVLDVDDYDVDALISEIRAELRA